MKPGTRATKEWLKWKRLFKSGKLCHEWQDFCTYYTDTGDIPPGYTLKRKNSRLKFSLLNCYWGKVSRDLQKGTWASILPLNTMAGK